MFSEDHCASNLKIAVCLSNLCYGSMAIFIKKTAAVKIDTFCFSKFTQPVSKQSKDT